MNLLQITLQCDKKMFVFKFIKKRLTLGVAATFPGIALV